MPAKPSSRRRDLLPLPRVAARLSLSYSQTYALALRGDLGAIEYRGSRLFVRTAEVERVRKLRLEGKLPRTRVPFTEDRNG